MLSVIIPARNSHALTERCLNSCVRTFGDMPDVDYVLVDDASDPSDKLGELFGEFNQAVKQDVTEIRSDAWLHYTGAFRAGMEAAIGDNLFLLSNDMMVTPDFVRTMLAVANLDKTIGVVRGCSAWCDSHPEHVIKPSPPCRTQNDVYQFSAHVAQMNGLTYTVDKLLSGDAVLIKRSVIDSVGHFDTQFFGFFGDPDFGIRTQRAGFKLVCAKGAWLHHEGGGHIRVEPNFDVKQKERAQLVQNAWAKFRAKWYPEGPEVFRSVNEIDFGMLVKRGPLDFASATPAAR